MARPAARQRSHEADVSRLVGQRKHEQMSAAATYDGKLASGTYPVMCTRSAMSLPFGLARDVEMRDLLADQHHVEIRVARRRRCHAREERADALFRRDAAKCADHERIGGDAVRAEDRVTRARSACGSSTPMGIASIAAAG